MVLFSIVPTLTARPILVVEAVDQVSILVLRCDARRCSNDRVRDRIQVAQLLH